MFNPFKKSFTDKEIIFFRYLSKIKLFEKLSYKEMSYFMPYFYLREYRNSEVVFFRNDPSNALYLVKSGKVSLALDVKNEFEKLTTFKSGNSFGENSLVQDASRVYSAIVTSERSELYVLPKVNIDEIFEGHLVVKAKMLESLCEMFNELNTKIAKNYVSNYGFFSLAQAHKS